jgi:tRNA-dihydrouridine synthase
MIHARNVVNDESFRQSHFDFHEGHEQKDLFPIFTKSSQAKLVSELPPEYEDSDSLRRWKHESNQITCGPLIVQLAGHDASTVVEAALIVLDKSKNIAGIDLNLGCPQGIARKGIYGAHLMDKQPEVAYQVLSALRQAMPSHVAVSAKIRLPPHWDRNESNLLKDRIHRLIDTGITFLTVHGRTIHENKATVGACHSDALQEAIRHAHLYSSNFPVVVNGGVEYPSDVSRILTGSHSSAAAVMSSEALLENPGLFGEAAAMAQTLQNGIDVDCCRYLGQSPQQIFERQFRYAFDYLKWCSWYPPLPGALGIHSDTGSWNIVRGHLFKLLHRYLQENVDIRLDLATSHAFSLKQAHAIVSDLQARYRPYKEGLLDWNKLPSSTETNSWYRRHRRLQDDATPAIQLLRLDDAPIRSAIERRKAAIRKHKSTTVDHC